MVARRPRVPDRGDVVWITLAPQAGAEQAGRRPAVVLSPAAYNGKVGLAFTVSDHERIKGYPFEVTIPAGLPVTGVVLSDQIKKPRLAHSARRADLRAAPACGDGGPPETWRIVDVTRKRIAHKPQRRHIGGRRLESSTWVVSGLPCNRTTRPIHETQDRLDISGSGSGIMVIWSERSATSNSAEGAACKCASTVLSANSEESDYRYLTGKQLKSRSTGRLLEAGIPAGEHDLCFETSSDSQR